MLALHLGILGWHMTFFSIFFARGHIATIKESKDSKDQFSSSPQKKVRESINLNGTSVQGHSQRVHSSKLKFVKLDIFM